MNDRPLQVLSPDDLRFFDDNGYVVVKNAVPRENLQAVIDAIFWFLEMDPNNPNDWYHDPLTKGGMVEMYQHPAMWANRQFPRLYGALADLHQRDDLWTSIDRVNLKPGLHPDHPEYDWTGMKHWDIEISQALTSPFGVQGVLYLADTTEDMGGFVCAPGHHKTVLEWAQEAPRKPGDKPDMSNVPVVPIPGEAGDFIVWNKLLYHGNGHNRSHKPRLAQYITMFLAPTGDNAASQRQARLDAFENREPVPAHWTIGDPRGKEKEEPPVELSPLGRKLLGLDAWTTA